MGRFVMAGFIGIGVGVASVGSASAADLVILGKRLLVKTLPRFERRLLGWGHETASPATVVGNPLANGATVTFIANGTGSSQQTFFLPPGARTAGTAGWTMLSDGFLWS